MDGSYPCLQPRTSWSADAPVETRANLAPATIEVASNLAEDTVIAGVMDIATGVNKVAMFANPFAGGSEEMLYVDEKHAMRWARHVNSPVADQQLGEQPSGWSIEPVMSDVAEVVVAVHPNGSGVARVRGNHHQPSGQLRAGRGPGRARRLPLGAG